MYLVIHFREKNWPTLADLGMPYLSVIMTVYYVFLYIHFFGNMSRHMSENFDHAATG